MAMAKRRSINQRSDSSGQDRRCAELVGEISRSQDQLKSVPASRLLFVCLNSGEIKRARVEEKRGEKRAPCGVGARSILYLCDFVRR